MQSKGQSAIEFLSTYSFTFLILAIVLFVLFLFASLPKATLPLQCVFYNNFNCEDLAYYNLGAGSQLVVFATDMQPGTMNVSNFSATINYISSVSGYCIPQLVTAGQRVYCVANFTDTEKVGTLYSGNFKIIGEYCAEYPSVSTYLNCTSASSISFGGTFQTEGTLYNPSFAPLPPDAFCVGGSSAPTATYFAPLSVSGIGQWTASNSYPISIVNAGCSVNNDYIYCVGSTSGTGNQVYYSSLSTNGVSPWTQTKSYPVSGMTNAGCSTYNNYIYCVGSGSGTNLVYYAPLTDSGTGNWISTNSYPVSMSSGSCLTYGSDIYCVGGTSSTNSVYYATVASWGVSAWKKSPNNYPISFISGGCSAYTGFIYCLGGTGAQNSIYYAPISGAGVGNWIAGPNYPTTLSSNGCFIYNRYLYCVGSSTSPNSQAYYAPILSPGVGSWVQTTSYPTGLQSAYCVVPGSAGGYLGGGGSPG